MRELRVYHETIISMNMQRCIALLCCLALVAGCTNLPSDSSATVNNSAEPVAAEVEETSELNQIIAVAEANARSNDVETFNRRLANLSAQAPVTAGDYEYRLGIGDIITVDAFQVEELRQFKTRIEGQGSVALPLLGQVRLAGKTVGDAEAILAQRLGEYLHNPKVSIFIDEYRSQEITVAGEVNNPGIYPLTRPRSLVEMLTLAGGLTETAGYKVNVQIREIDPATGQAVPQNLLVDLRDLVNDEKVQRALVLRGGDSIFVPKAGVFFVEGSVKKPGSYPIQGEMDVLKAVAVTQGMLWEAVDDEVRIIRREGGTSQVIPVDVAAARENRAPEVLIRDGDIIVVGYSSFKRGFAAFWKGLSGIFGIGYGI